MYAHVGETAVLARARVIGAAQLQIEVDVLQPQQQHESRRQEGTHVTLTVLVACPPRNLPGRNAHTSHTLFFGNRSLRGRRQHDSIHHVQRENQPQSARGTRRSWWHVRSLTESRRVAMIVAMAGRTSRELSCILPPCGLRARSRGISERNFGGASPSTPSRSSSRSCRTCNTIRSRTHGSRMRRRRTRRARSAARSASWTSARTTST